MANQVVAGTNAGYDLSEEIRKQKAAELESALASLKGAYDKSMGSLDSAKAKLPQTYEAARNEVAAQRARSARAFDERALAAGLNTGTAGQADLARSSTLRRDLANIGQQEANARNELDLQRAGIEADYQAALAKARAEGDASLANALYNEMVRVQDLNRQDAILQAEREYAAGRDAVADKQWQDAFDYQAAQDLIAQQQWREQMEYQAALDKIAQEQWQKQFDYGKEQDRLDNDYRQSVFDQDLAQSTSKTAYDRAMDQILMGVRPDSATIASAGLSDAVVNAMLAQVLKAQEPVETPKDTINSDALAIILGQMTSQGASGGSSGGGSSGGSAGGSGSGGGKTTVYTPEPEYKAPTVPSAPPQYDEEDDEPVYEAPAPSNKYTGTNYMQDAIDAAMRGDRETAEAALAARAEKMSSPDYHGTGGGTSMEEARAQIEQLLAEQAEEDETPVVAKPIRDTDGRTYDNGTLTRDQVMMLQELYDVENVDGLWGRESTAKAGMTAEEAWDYYQSVNGYPDEEPELTTTNRHGESWVQVNGNRMTWVELENKVNSGEIEEEIDQKTGTVTYRKAN